MTQRESTQLQKLEIRVGELEETIDRLTKELASAVGELKTARDELKRTTDELEQARQELQQAREEYLTMDRGISELLLAVCGNARFNQDGIVQNLKHLTEAVTELQQNNAQMKADHAAVKAEVQSLDGTRRWVRAKAALAASAIGTSITGGLWWAITHLQTISEWFNPPKH